MIRVLILLCAATAAVHAAGRDFDRLVSAIEKHYGVKRTHVPLMGFANFVVKVAHPAGTSGFTLATFEDLPAVPDQAELERVIDDVCRGGLRRVVVTHSRRDREASYILAGEAGKSTELLIATFERTEATVIEVKVDLDALFRMLGTPADAHNIFQDHGDDNGHTNGGR